MLASNAYESWQRRASVPGQMAGFPYQVRKPPDRLQWFLSTPITLIAFGKFEMRP